VLSAIHLVYRSGEAHFKFNRKWEFLAVVTAGLTRMVPLHGNGKKYKKLILIPSVPSVTRLPSTVQLQNTKIYATNIKL
jgi:hypothetical protein